MFPESNRTCAFDTKKAMENHKRKALLIVCIVSAVLLIAAGIIIAVVLNRGRGDAYRSIRVQSLEGTVRIIRTDETMDAYESMNLKNKDRIVTEKDSSCVLKLDDDKYVYVGPVSVIDLESSEKASEAGKTVLKVTQGSILTEVQNKLGDNETFDVETPNSTMAIRGTKFKTQVISKDGRCQILYSLYQGSIELSMVERSGDGYAVSTYTLEPMQEIQIVAEEQNLVSLSELDEVKEKIRNSDSTVTEKKYDDFEELVNDSDALELVKETLTEDEIKDDLDALKSITSGNQPSGTQSETEKGVVETGKSESETDGKESDSETETEIRIIESESENDNESESMTPPLETETDPVQTETETERESSGEDLDGYRLTVVMQSGESTTYGVEGSTRLSLSRKLKNYEIFLGWYVMKDGAYTCLSSDEALVLDVDKDMTIYPVILYSHVAGENPYALWINGEAEVKTISLKTGDAFDPKAFEFSLKYGEKTFPLSEEFVEAQVNYRIYRSNGSAGSENNEEVRAIDTHSPGMFVIMYTVGSSYQMAGSIVISIS